MGSWLPVGVDEFLFKRRVRASKMGGINRAIQNSTMPVATASCVPSDDQLSSKRRKREHLWTVDDVDHDDWPLNHIVRRCGGELPRPELPPDTGQEQPDQMMVSVVGAGYESPVRIDDWSLNWVVRSADGLGPEVLNRSPEMFDINVGEERALMTTRTNSDIVVPPVAGGSSSNQGLASAALYLPIAEHELFGGGDICNGSMSSDSKLVASQQDSCEGLGDALTHATLLPVDRQQSVGGGAFCNGSVDSAIKSTDTQDDSSNGLGGALKYTTLLPIAKEQSVGGGVFCSGSGDSASKSTVTQEDSARVKDCDLRESGSEDSESLGASLTDSFTAEEMKDYLRSFTQLSNVGVGMTRPERVADDTCQLCLEKKLSFAAPPMDCARCGALLKSNSSFYVTAEGMGTRYYFCTPCKNSRGRTISVKEQSFFKDQLVRCLSVEGPDEPWVQCDECFGWQHITCALYNQKLDLEEKMKYTCPFCRLTELEAGEHATLVTPFGAGDLPRTILSDDIEQRLLKNLARERMQRAESLGKSPLEVPGAEDLVVRVVLAVDKQIKVKQPFLDILQGKTYPQEFPYKSKVILLFQKIDGVEVCLFAMYVQEFGSECEQPNKRSVYISYLDSVRYFTPDVKTVTGLPLRTFVYHEVLIGYLDYCKRRGFSTGYIWACPPLKGDDYILYCHPKIQKTPKTQQLRKWYKTMLKKALNENVVTEWTNFHDRFFVPKDNENSKITVARLPYFDGSYWTGAVEDLMLKMEKEKACAAGVAQKKTKKLISKRTLKAMGHDGLSADSLKDAEVMQKLGEKIHSMKEDFIVVHFQHICKNCHEAILSGSCWSCMKCSNYHLCTRCLDAKQSPDGLRTHTTIHGEDHLLSQIPVNDVAVDTKDKDVILESDIFENRHTFLNFCQTNNYQFDTIIHAKHSTMMILHQLHNKTLLSLRVCSICHQDFPVGWHCENCSQFYTCNVCFQKEGDGCHFHKLSELLVRPRCRIKSKKVRQEREHTETEVKSIVELLAHVIQCPSTEEKPCPNPKCHLMKKMFYHILGDCTASPHCATCNAAWNVLNLHARSCQDSNCTTPHCWEIKKLLAAAGGHQPRADTIVYLD